MRTIMLLAAMAAATALSTPAFAGNPDGHWQIKLLGTGVLPDGKQSPSAAARFTLVWPTPLDLPSGRNPAPTPPATATKKP